MAVIEKTDALTQTQVLMLSTLARLRFATAEQLMQWCPLGAMSSVRRCAQRLASAGLIEINTELKPFVYRLSRKGCRAMGQRYFRTWHSFSAMQQVLLRNQVEIQLLNEDDKSASIDRAQLAPLGLHPAHSEYAFVMPNRSSLFQLVVIDDYLMQSNRILHKWQRPHLKTSTTATSTTLKRWCDVCDGYRIYTITELQAIQHRAFLAQAGIPNASVTLIEPVWGVSQ